MNRQTLDLFARHAGGAAVLVQPFVLWAMLTGFSPLHVLLGATVAAAALGWAVELMQRAFGWGHYSLKDVAVTAAGGPIAWGGVSWALYVV